MLNVVAGCGRAVQATANKVDDDEPLRGGSNNTKKLSMSKPITPVLHLDEHCLLLARLQLRKEASIRGGTSFIYTLCVVSPLSKRFLQT